jgi:hypothetical protein
MENNSTFNRNMYNFRDCYSPKGYYKEFLPKEVYDLYKDEYWSNHTYLWDLNKIDDLLQIGHNRKIIAEKYKLKKLGNKKIPQYATKEFIVNDKHSYIKDMRDHNEYFITENKNYVCIFSRYYNDVDTKTILENGYEEIEPIYNIKDKSFIKIIPKKERL